MTSLLVSKDLLWAGTSAGVVLTVALPNVPDGKAPLQFEGEPQCLGCGHTGHVRFLTEIEVVETTSLPEKGENFKIVYQLRADPNSLITLSSRTRDATTSLIRILSVN